MDLKQYLKIIGKNYKLIIIVALLVAAGVGLISWQTKAKYNVSLLLLITKTGQEKVTDYDYDGYYTLKAADEFGKSVVQWLKRPEVARNIYQRAQLEGIVQNLRNPSRFLRAQQLDAQHVEVRFSAASKEQVEKISSAIPKVLQEKADNIAVASLQAIRFSILGEDTSIVFKELSVLLNTFLGFLVGLFLGIFVVFAKEYFF